MVEEKQSLKFALPKIFKRTPQTRFIFFLVSDVFLIGSAVLVSFLLRFDFSIPSEYRPYLTFYIGISLLTLLPIFYFKRLYHFTWIYVGINELIATLTAVSYGFLFLTFLLFIGRDHVLAKSFPRSIILVDYVVVFILVGGLRFSKRLYGELLNKRLIQQEGKPKLLIIGAGDAAEQLVRSIKQIENYPFHLIGILDDSDLKQNTSIHDTKVLGRIKDIPRIKARENVGGIIIAIPSATSIDIKRIVALAEESGIKFIKTLPSLSQFVTNRVSVKDVRDIDVQDLLGRQKVEINLEEIASLVKNKSILVTGAAGSIGVELVQQISALSPRLLLALDNNETGMFEVERFLNKLSRQVPRKIIIANILHKDKINRVMEEYHPEIVFHSAAYKHVGLMEEEPDEAVLNNVLGTWNVAQAALQGNAEKFVFISTDKAVNPTSVMGMTKRVAEQLILYYNHMRRERISSQFIAVRFGNVLGSRGSVVPLFKEQIRSGGPVTITHPDMKRYFMIPSEAILLVLHAAYLGRGGEIFVLDMGVPIRIVDLAETMIRLAGFEPYKDIPIVFTKPSSGEKLFENILTDTEHMRVTKNKKIFIAPNTSALNQKTFFSEVEQLINDAKKGNSEEVRSRLAKLTA